MSTFDQCYSHENRRYFGWLNGDALVESLFARDFGQKLNFKVRHSKAITFYDPEWTRPKDIFLARLHVAVFHESGTDQKRTVTPIDQCFYHQKRRWFGWLNGDVLVESLFARDFGQKLDLKFAIRKRTLFTIPNGPDQKTIV